MLHFSLMNEELQPLYIFFVKNYRVLNPLLFLRRKLPGIIRMLYAGKPCLNILQLVRQKLAVTHGKPIDGTHIVAHLVGIACLFNFFM